MKSTFFLTFFEEEEELNLSEPARLEGTGIASGAGSYWPFSLNSESLRSASLISSRSC